VVAGNLYETEPNTPRADASNGLWLRGDGKGRFFAVSPAESGFLAPRDASGLSLLGTAEGEMIVVANVADSLQIFRLRRR
jgi:enediyne biosynthesis protein E4